MAKLGETENPPVQPDAAVAAPRPTSPGVAEGEDDGLILWMLSLTPTERLAVAQGFVDSIVALRNGRRA
jgi:hypothetical protein